MDSPDASSRAIGRPSGDLEKRGGEEGGWWRERGLFFRGVEDEDCWFCYTGTGGSECPGAAKGGCCLSRNGSELAAPGAVIAW